MIALWLVMAQAAEVVFVVAGADLEDDFAAELQLADPGLTVVRQEAGEDWSGLSAGDQRGRVREWVRTLEADAALWLTDPPEVHVWVPSEDRDLSVSVRASTDAPAGELAMVALQHLASMGWPAPVEPVTSVSDPVQELRQVGGLPRFLDTVSLSGGLGAAGDLGPDGLGPRPSAWFRFAGEAGTAVPWVELGGRVGVADPTELSLRGDVEASLGAGAWVRWNGLGPTVGVRASRRALGWRDGGRQRAAWWDASLVPGVRLRLGSGSLRPVVWAEVPVGLRDRVWRDDQGVAMRISAVQWAAGAGLAGVFRKVDGV